MQKSTSFFIWILLLFTAMPELWAQVDVKVEVKRRTHLIGEPIIVSLYMRNNTDRPVILTNEPNRPWLHLNVTSSSHPNGVPRLVIPRFPTVTISSGSTVAYNLNVYPSFRFQRSGTYQISAVLRMPDHRTTYGSNSASFTLNEGHSFRYFNIQNKGRHLQIHAKSLNVNNMPGLFGQIIDANSKTPIASCFLGNYLNFVKPIFILDKHQHMHVLFQNNPQHFIHAIVSPTGQAIQKQRMARTGGPIDLIAVGDSIRPIGVAPVKKPSKEKPSYHNITDVPD